MKVEVFSSPQCGYCEQAKQLLQRKGVAFETLDIAVDEKNREELMRRLPRTRALPQIFIGGAHIGSFEDLQILDSRGELDALLKK